MLIFFDIEYFVKYFSICDCFVYYSNIILTVQIIRLRTILNSGTS